jgi:methionine biosynthesis protein MetW
MLNSPWIRKPDFTKLGVLNYEKYWEGRGIVFPDALKPREIIMRDLIPRGSTVLDLGCGISRPPLTLKEKGVRVEIADISATVVEAYKKQGISGYVKDIEDVRTLAPSATYDFIILSEVLEHTRNPEEIVTALKPYAKRFLITVPNSAAYVFRYGLLVRGRFFTQWVLYPSEHLRFWSHIDFLDWLEALGLSVEETIPSDGFTLRGLMPWLPSLWKNLLSYRIVYQCKT